MVFDPRVFLEAIDAATEDAVRSGLQQVAARAKHKAPVRRIFKGERKILLQSYAKGSVPIGLNESKGPAFRYSERAAASVGFLHSGRAFVSPVFRSITSTGRTAGDIKHNIAAQRTVPVDIEDRIAARGRPNSRQPVIRVEGLGRITGNFREMSKPGELAHGLIYARVNGRTVRGDISSALTARGKYELAHVATRGHVNAEGDRELGGALRDSIKFEGPFVGRGEVWGTVSAAAFNESGFNYAYAQEMGTGHNRPQPFLRPAMRELHGQIVKGQRNALSTALRNAHSTRQDYKGFRRNLKLELDIVGFQRIEKGVNDLIRSSLGSGEAT